MGTNRLEAFSDGVMAIIITIMVLELEVPHSPSLAAIANLWPTFFSYLLSFIYVGIYWNNHHHMMQAAQKVTGGVLWSNLHLLFWLSLLPFTTGWMGENEFDRLPTMLYGINLLLCAVAYYVLEHKIIVADGKDSLIAHAIGADFKGKVSPFLYILGIGSTWFVAPWAGLIFFVSVTVLWLKPDTRIEEAIGDD
ncbi:MAG: DUF1211 domain-containing protein [Sphingobium sp.]|nr:DUF1211 domain-containing protein [Sphingobium sp.]MBP6112313.1 DUF1211 domain-containing protein [Sphingobium sp.]MBP8670100.1 DUF1211 domain-containing protein [Sphingobium sp.]MBP9157395.1 DUF1211 domain-containing protein [Sphingobium sp.]